MKDILLLSPAKVRFYMTVSIRDLCSAWPHCFCLADGCPVGDCACALGGEAHFWVHHGLVSDLWGTPAAVPGHLWPWRWGSFNTKRLLFALKVY